MTGPDTQISTLRVTAPRKAARQARLRLSTQLGGADLHPPGLAPSQVLLVRQLADPEPGRLGVEQPGAALDRTWERAVRDALTDCLRRAVRPTSGRVPPGAEAVLFRDAAEAWACWGRAQGADGPSPPGSWWTQSLEASSDAPPTSAGRSPGVAAVWKARPRLVPAIAAHLAAWGDALDVLRQTSTSEAEDVLRAVCTAFDAPPPTLQVSADRADDDRMSPPASLGMDEQRQITRSHSEEGKPEIPSVPSGAPPWTSFVEEAAGTRLADALARESPAHRQLLGVALALRDDPVTVRSRSFRSAWRAWRQAPGRPVPGTQGGEEEAPSRSPADPQDRPGEEGETEGPEGPERKARASEEGGSYTEDDSSGKEDASPVDDLELDGDRRPQERTSAGDGKEARWEAPYTVTDLGGVLYLVNVLDALDLPAAATTPPVGEHVGAWAVLGALARALLGPDDDALRPSDPLWRALAALDGRRPETPAGQALDDAEEGTGAFRTPPEWLDAPHVDPPVDGRWAVADGRLRVWTRFGCVADLEAGDNPAAQAAAEWDRVPNTGDLQRASSADTMPRAHEPADCAPALAHWTARTVPYVRHRLAAALGVDDPEAGWVADLFRAEGRLYTTDVNVDLVLPLDAARIDTRVAGLDRSPGWWPAGGRIVRFHFREADV